MKTFKIGDKEYTLEYTFEAAEHKQLVQHMFNMLSGAYVIRNGTKREAMAYAMFDGVAEMVADIPSICRTAFYAGLLEHNKISEKETKTLMKQYMKENGLTFAALYDELRQEMENDGFFDLSGIQDMIQKMNRAVEEAVSENQTRHRGKKQTTTG